MKTILLALVLASTPIHIRVQKKVVAPEIITAQADSSDCKSLDCSGLRMRVQNPFRETVSVTFDCGANLTQPVVTLPPSQISVVVITANSGDGIYCAIDSWKKETK